MAGRPLLIGVIMADCQHEWDSDEVYRFGKREPVRVDHFCIHCGTKARYVVELLIGSGWQVVSYHTDWTAAQNEEKRRRRGVAEVRVRADI